MAELSRTTGVPVPTIKYYLREGLLPAGERTRPNQANYDDSHVRRLRLVRALLDLAGMTIIRAREVLDAIDDPGTTSRQVLGTAQRSVAQSDGSVRVEDREWAMGALAEVADARGWHLHDRGHVLDSLIATLVAIRDVGQHILLARLEDYATVADQIAEVDVSCFAEATTLEEQVELATAGTALTDTLLANLRRIAQKNALPPDWP
ncbi:MerR family transcriptional regulator [Amycolatopsis ultiminotia]